MGQQFIDMLRSGTAVYGHAEVGSGSFYDVLRSGTVMEHTL